MTAAQEQEFTAFGFSATIVVAAKTPEEAAFIVGEMFDHDRLVLSSYTPIKEDDLDVGSRV